MIDNFTTKHFDDYPEYTFDEAKQRAHQFFPRGVTEVSGWEGSRYFTISSCTKSLLDAYGREKTAIHAKSRSDLDGRPLRFVFVAEYPTMSGRSGLLAVVAGSLPAFYLPDQKSAWLRADEAMDALRLRGLALEHCFGIRTVNPPVLKKAELCWQTRHENSLMLRDVGERLLAQKLGGFDWTS